MYQAFLDPQAVARWLAPEAMRVQVYTFNPYEGGEFRLSLVYQNGEDAQRGKTSGNMDTYHGRFAQLIPDELIVEVIEFETQEPEFADDKTMTVKFTDVVGGTEVSLLYENVPAGIRPEDNETGSRQALRKLAALVE